MWFLRVARPRCSKPASKATRRFSSCLRLWEPKTSENLDMSWYVHIGWEMDASSSFSPQICHCCDPGWIEEISEEIWRKLKKSHSILNILEQFHCPLADSKLLHAAPLVSSQGTLNVSSLNRIVDPKPFPNTKPSICIHLHPSALSSLPRPLASSVWSASLLSLHRLRILRVPLFSHLF